MDIDRIKKTIKIILKMMNLKKRKIKKINKKEYKNETMSNLRF